MKIAENVHLIRKEFYVTPEVKRYINIYLITGESCYLIDSGVFGSEKIIDEYLHSIGRNMSDIKGIFLTHAHPDHIGGAAEIKRITDCKVYAPMLELDWIEDIDIQYRERPIPNFYTLLSESVKVDVPLQDGDSVTLEKGIEICALLTRGHSHGSMSFIFGDNIIFTGDAIPVAHDLPIFVDYEQSLYSLDRINELSNVQYFCPAWDEIYDKIRLKEVVNDSKRMLHKLKDAVHQVEKEYKQYDEADKLTMIFKQADILQYAGNQLVVKSIDACRKYLLQMK
ncbi:MAG: MBL fold metallo-hydrolase [Lachnospiraceae bacterium]|nr:MBL fold metallo-hydrolase [Lachnospiraceae bacterium]MBQ8148391.1 MBL fold metallo-hydrolase [Lachnospiraceae bacterium]